MADDSRPRPRAVAGAGARLPRPLRPRRQPLRLAALLAALALTAAAPVVTFTWEPHPQAELVAGYELGLGTNNTAADLTVLPTGPELSAAVDFPGPGLWFARVRAVATNGWRSPWSDALTVPLLSPPQLAGQSAVALRFRYELSPDLAAWRSATSAPTFLLATNAQEFYRPGALILERVQLP